MIFQVLDTDNYLHNIHPMHVADVLERKRDDCGCTILLTTGEHVDTHENGVDIIAAWQKALRTWVPAISSVE